MSTKNNPGQFDCYKNAGPDEPMFVLLARDIAAPGTIWDWAKKRVEFGKNLSSDPQIQEALECAGEMQRWYNESAAKDKP